MRLPCDTAEETIPAMASIPQAQLRTNTSVFSRRKKASVITSSGEGSRSHPVCNKFQTSDSLKLGLNQTSASPLLCADNQPHCSFTNLDSTLSQQTPPAYAISRISCLTQRLTTPLVLLCRQKHNTAEDGGRHFQSRRSYRISPSTPLHLAIRPPS